MAGALNQNLTCEGNTHETTAGDVVKCIIIIIIMLLIISGNVCCLVVFNNKRSRRHFMKRVRYIMNSLCCTDLSIGLLMCPSTIYPALTHCWPFGEGFCKFEALLISALFHESTLNMVLIAVDRYFIVHFPSYHVKMTSKRFVLVILTSWVVVFTAYAIIIFAGDQFYFDEIGINCEPFYKNPDVTLSVLSIFYFVPALIFLFCYGSIYRTATQQTVLNPANAEEKHSLKRLHANIRTSKYLAAITLAFFVAVSPWTLSTLIVVAANVTLQNELDFAITWLALSNSFMNCLIYGVMNRKFRRAAMRFTCGRWVKSVRDTLSSSRVDEDSKDFSEDTMSRSFTKSKSRASEKKKRMRSVNSNLTASPPPSPRPSPRPSPPPSPQTTRDRNNIALNHLTPN